MTRIAHFAILQIYGPCAVIASKERMRTPLPRVILGLLRGAA